MTEYKPRILVVQSDARTRRQLEGVLRTLGANPQGVSSSRQAATRVNKEKFDGVFLHWDLSGISGEDLTRMIRRSKSNAKVPIVVVTGADDTRAMAQGFRAGATFTLAEPVGPKEAARLLHASFTAMVEERRRYQRVPTQLPVVCAWEEERITGQSVNISATGLLLSIDPQPGVKTQVQLEFTLPVNGQANSLPGVVVRASEGSQVGIKFAGLTRDQREELKSSVEKIGPKRTSAR
ncbi:MAG: PilZ domain-containing protein, partial [Terriglobia bacterium]